MNRFSLEDHQVTYESSGLNDPSSGARLDRITAPLTYTDTKGLEWTAPTGALTDGASIPDAALSLTGRPNRKEIFRPAIVHDAYCQESSQCPKELRSRPWKATHDMFYEACLTSGATERDAAKWWAAVRLFGPKWDAQGRVIPNSLISIAHSGWEILVESIWKRPNVNFHQAAEAKLSQWERFAEESNRLQLASIDAMKRGETLAASQALKQAEDLLGRESWDDPESEVIRLTLRGYSHKDQAMAHLEEGDLERPVELLALAQSDFMRVLEIHPRDPGALSGMSSVHRMCGELAQRQGQAVAASDYLEKAEKYIDAALESAPQYAIAKEERVLLDETVKGKR